jgi:hypothetical protein
VVHCRAAAPYGRVGPAPLVFGLAPMQMIQKTSTRHPKASFEIRKKILLIF